MKTPRTLWLCAAITAGFLPAALASQSVEIAPDAGSNPNNRSGQADFVPHERARPSEGGVVTAPRTPNVRQSLERAPRPLTPRDLPRR
ncbi:hypothetical protein J2T57_001120 [Natronocella acetinitrilica]|uniref:Uncharacterized protein n=1 Tax=Natronocella acetinitrilica TaxID=414046 RepID=A0AAE3G3H2_9GAMM|nr:hypothetical protein [Natronocella acetinitrilica]